ncbi:hypothetical protein ACOMHN_056990 [Nucella lapillus]
MVDFRGFKHSDVPEGARGGVNKHREVQKSKKILSRFERGRLPVAARLPALLLIVFFYSLNILKMVDFRGFKHSDVPKEGRRGGNKHRGVQKSKRLGLNIPKKADFRNFKHSDVPEGAREGVNKHRGVQKSKKNFLSRFERGRLPVAARLPALL